MQLLQTKSGLGYVTRPRHVVHSAICTLHQNRGRAAAGQGGPLRASTAGNTQTSKTPAAPPAAPSEAPAALRSLASLSSVASLSSIDEVGVDTSSFRFLPSQLEVFRELGNSMQNCSRGLAALAFGSVVMNAIEAVEHAHHNHVEHAQHAVQAVAEAGAAAAEAVAAHGAAVAGQLAEAVPAVAGHASAGGAVLLQELMRAVSLTDVAFCVNEVIPALLIAYAAVPFEQLARNPDEPQMELALKGVGRLSLTLQQLAWTSGSVAVVLLLTAAVEYPPLVGVASGACLALAVARGAALWWVLSQHTTSGEEVARTLATLRGGAEGREMSPLDRAASWLALGVLLQAEEQLHANHHRHHHTSHGAHHTSGHAEAHAAAHNNGEGNGAVVASVSPASGADPYGLGGSPVPAAAAVALPALPGGGAVPLPAGPGAAKPHYSFDLEEERVLRSLVEAAIAAGLAISLLVLATLALGLAEAAGDNSNGWVSSVILASQKAANALALFASATAFDRALHNDDGNDDTDHLLDGLGREHSGMTGLFNSMAVLSLALFMAGCVALLVPSLEESPVGVLLGDGVMHASADLLMEVLEAL